MKLASNPRLRDWAAYWLETYVRPVAKPSGYEHYHDNLHKHILPKLGNYRLSKLTTPVVQAFLNEAAEHGNLRTGGALSAKSIKNMRVVLDVCCKRAVAEGYMAANPVQATVYKHCTSQRVEVMSDAHQQALEKWLFQDLSLQNAGITLGLYTGMRLGEVCAARWKNYDFMTGCLRVEQTLRRVSKFDDTRPYGKRTELVFSAVKTDASNRDLFLPPILQDLMVFQFEHFQKLFGRAPGGEDFIIFNNKGGCMDPDNLTHYFGDVLEGLELPHVKYHALRHTFATRAVEKGIDLSTIAGLLGHADVTTTMHYYVHPREETMRQAMAAIGPVSQLYTRRNPRLPVGFIPNQTVVDPAPARVCRRRKHIASQ